MEKLNYGLALGHNGDWQVALTVHHPGIRDDFSLLLSESFTYLVAPHHFIDQSFNLSNLSPDQYLIQRDSILKYNSEKIKEAILSFHNFIPKTKTYTW